MIADDAIDEEISAAENMVRVNMHPVDQFTAFHKLLERGLSVSEIANRFGLTTRRVQRRLRLGAVAPQILSEAREDRLTLELLEAFAATPDRARQLDVWNKMQSHNGYAPTAGWIRNELLQQMSGGGTGTRSAARLPGSDSSSLVVPRATIPWLGWKRSVPPVNSSMCTMADVQTA